MRRNRDVSIEIGMSDWFKLGSAGQSDTFSSLPLKADITEVLAQVR